MASIFCDYLMLRSRTCCALLRYRLRDANGWRKRSVCAYSYPRI